MTRKFFFKYTSSLLDKLAVGPLLEYRLSGKTSVFQSNSNLNYKLLVNQFANKVKIYYSQKMAHNLGIIGYVSKFPFRRIF